MNTGQEFNADDAGATPAEALSLEGKIKATAQEGTLMWHEQTPVPHRGNNMVRH